MIPVPDCVAKHRGKWRSAIEIQRFKPALRVVAILAGLLLAVIGVRFLVVPDQAARTFGLAKVIAGSELQFIIGLRDLWLGGLAVAFALLKEWRALALWFGLGTLVCFSDAAIAATSSGRTGPVVFHLVCGVACAVIGALSWRVGRV
ncbi:MAG: hypothetical protein CTY31_01550 [Hyphomicrobium sp.]|nr:MAG: hypothetical protein CTY31_01550 [Hyphomicrobium sp.]